MNCEKKVIIYKEKIISGISKQSRKNMPNINMNAGFLFPPYNINQV